MSRDPHIPTGYGPRTTKFSRLLFDGDENKYEQWEVKFMGYMRLQKLKDTITQEDDEDIDEEKNAESYAELIQYLDDKSLSLIMRDAADDGRKALKILREHYASPSTPRIIGLYTELTSLVKKSGETVTEYLIRAETSTAALKTTGETISDSLLIAMIIKGLPDSYKSFVAVITQSDKKQRIQDFKVALRTFEETENSRNVSDSDSILKSQWRGTVNSRRGTGASVRPSFTGNAARTRTCYNCGVFGHFAKDCVKQSKRLWCNICKKNNHSEQSCRFNKNKQDRTKGQRYNESVNSVCVDGNSNFGEHFVDENSNFGEHFAFMASSCRNEDKKYNETCQPNLLVDCGATAHIVRDISVFSNFDETFEPENHTIELANGDRVCAAMKRGEAKLKIKDSEGNLVNCVLKDTLYVPSFPQNIFSVQAATNKGGRVTFSAKSAEFMFGPKTFPVVKKGKLYYLSTDITKDVDSVNLSQDISDWHRTLGHCNFDDVLKLENVVDGMKIKGNKTKTDCEVCVKGKMPNTKKKSPRERATAPLELIHTDLAGPITPSSQEGFKYAISFTDDFSGAVSIYCLKNKSDSVVAMEKFLADSSPYGKVKTLRSDNGTEFTSEEFQRLLRKNLIKHERSAPYSPHQNGTAERQWRTIFEMGRCMLLEKKLPKVLWPYAVHTAVYTRNRCFNARVSMTPMEALTGRRPNISNMRVFGSDCYAYSQQKQKLDERCQKGIFMGYDRCSPANLVYFPDTGKVKRCRLVHFLSDKTNARLNYENHSTPTGDHHDDENETYVKCPTNENILGDEEESECMPQDMQRQIPQGGETQGMRNVGYPQRHREPPKHFSDYEVYQFEDKIMNSVDYCYTFSGFPQTYKEAIASPESQNWQKAMKEEIQSLKENDTYTLTPLPDGKKIVGGKWVYTIKEDAYGSKSYKARYVAKGYSQKEGLDYHETFAPTAHLTSVRALMQLAAQNNLILHQMDVKTAYLNAPIDYEIFMEQPEGFEVEDKTGQGLFCKLNKSLYGLKQSGRNWNQMLHTFLKQNGFVSSATDSCIYTKCDENDMIVILAWVDDFVVATSNESLLTRTKQMFKDKFNMKDLGNLSYFLGIEFEQGHDFVRMHQQRYITKLLEKYGMSDCKPRGTPSEPKLEWDESEPVDSKKYREIVGSLIYLMVCTRPDISWVVTRLSQFLSKPLQCHWITLKHVLRYLKGTTNYALCYRKSEKGLRLIGYSDSDWASSAEDRRSTSGYCFSLSEDGPLISWKSRKQPTVALSTCEAEYIALAAAVQEMLYLDQFLQSIDIVGNHLPVIYEDNQGTIALANNPLNRQRSKHIDVRYHFIRTEVNNRFELQYCPSEEMLADIMTKPATKSQLNKFQRLIFGK